jgi:hypothetical protein
LEGIAIGRSKLELDIWNQSVEPLHSLFVA